VESIILTQGFNGELLKFPLHLWYLPTALSPCAPINRATSFHLSAGNGDPTIPIHPTSTSIVSASEDTHVRFWQLPDQRTIAIFQHPHLMDCVTFSTDDKHILNDDVPKDASPEEALDIPAPKVFFRCFLVHPPSHIDLKAQGSDFRARLHVLL
jgi:hypothetical protein